MAIGGCIQKISEALNPVSEEIEADAAVVLLLKSVGRNIKVLFVKRVENPNDPWSGQIALPGGKRDAKDRNLKQTVIRETFEETHINLHEGCRFLGAMEPLWSTRRPDMKILPFVVLLKKKKPISLNEELTGYFWALLKELAKHRGTTKFSFGEYPAYIIENHVVWGLTYRILNKLINIIENS